MKSLIFVVAFVFLASSVSCIRTRDFNEYWSLERINNYILEMGERFPNITEVEEFGITKENRTIHAIRIVNNDILQQRNFSMPIVLITGGASARDWISMMAAVQLIHGLVEHYETNRILVDYLEWFIVPVLNPDGYEFSQADEANRAWIKNRRPNEGSDCIGVNIERNFDFNWDTEINSSTDPCDNNFRGPTTNSEEETRIIEYFLKYTVRVSQAYISIQAGIPQSFNGFVAYPFAASGEIIPDDWDRKRAIANDMSASTRRSTGARYLVGSVANVAGASSGTSADFATSVTEVPFAFTIFTAPGGQNGWDVEAWRINPIVDQVYAAVDDLARHLIFMPTN